MRRDGSREGARATRRWRVVLACALLGAAVGSAARAADDQRVTRALHAPQATHVDQQQFETLIDQGQAAAAFEEAFEVGDSLFETPFNVLDGVGANVGHGERFTRVPRADLSGPGEWATHTPWRATGPNAQSCTACHNVPGDDGAGGTGANVHRDPLHRGVPGSFIQRNTPHTFGAGGVQRLAEEMTETLQAIRADAVARACRRNSPVTASLRAKGVAFGTIAVRPSFGDHCQNPRVDTSRVEGVSADLVVRPFQWKGNVAFLRDFNRSAAHNELGMQPVELVGDGVDGDGDGVRDELSIGDMTALAVYTAAQPRPTSKLELAALGLIDPLPATTVQAIGRGRAVFASIGCDTCHRASLPLDTPIFSEPSRNPSYRDASFPAGQSPGARGVDLQHAITFDLTADQPDNRIAAADGSVVHLGSFARGDRGGAIVELYGDLKRHDMGPGLAESIDEVGTGALVFLTENLWGVGTTAPYLHDGRASTLTEAIVAHGGEAAAAQRAFLGLPVAAQKDLIAFLDNLVLFKAARE